jgi:hypothetical protein
MRGYKERNGEVIGYTNPGLENVRITSEGGRVQMNIGEWLAGPSSPTRNPTYFDSTRTHAVAGHIETVPTIQVENKKTYRGLGEYIGRPSVLGNPFSHTPGPLVKVVVKTREEAVERYYNWLREEWKRNTAVKAELLRLAKIYRDTGKLTLICWCAPQKCHGDVLATVIPKLVKLLEV